MDNNSIKVENMYKHFGEGDTRFDVIEDASFEVNKGEVVALIAPSGAGKTTLLMMIGCVSDPTSGKMWIGDELVYDDKWIVSDTRSIRRKKIGFIFQKSYLIPFLNVIENVILLPENNHVPQKQVYSKAKELLAYFDISDKEKSMPNELSGGQQQRVAIVRALANEPQIILADEPTAALDTNRSISVVEMLKKVAREQNVAVIMVTHDDTVIPYCDRIMEIVDKKVVMKKVEDVHLL